MNKHNWYWNRCVLTKDFVLRPTLQYKDVKDLKIFKYVQQSFPIIKNAWLADISVPCYGNRHHKDMTLEEALKWYGERPDLFRADELAHLYSYIAFYDPLIMEKVKIRTYKYETKQSGSDSKSLGES